MAFRFTVNPKSIDVEFETGSCAEALAILQDEKTALGEIFRTYRDLQPTWGGEIDATGAPLAPNGSETQGAAEQPKGRGRPRKAATTEAPAVPAAPAAPAPIPVPAAPPLAPVAAVPPVAPASTDGLDVPAFLDRRPGAAPAAVAAPPAPPVAAAPPPPPPPPPAASSNFNTALAEAVEKALRARPGFETDKGASLASWLITNGVKATAGSTFDEVAVVLKFTDQGVLNPIADALGVAG